MLRQFLLVKLLFIALSSPLLAWNKLESPLEKKMGEHNFQFKCKKYIFTIMTDGNMYISSPKDEAMPSRKKDIYLSYYSKVKDKNDNQYHHFKSMKTKGKATSRGFNVLITGTLGNGVEVTSLIQGNSSQMIVSVETNNLGNDKYMWFRVSHPEAKEDFLKGAVLISPEKGKSFTHKCAIPYVVSNYSKHLKSTVVKKRQSPDIVFSKGKSEGYMFLSQYSHFQGSDLNDPFHIHYRNDKPKWVGKKNTVALNF